MSGDEARTLHHSAPLSVVQQRLWQAIERGENVGAWSLSIMLTGHADEGALRSAIVALGERHAMLRATVTTIDARPTLAFAQTPPDLLTIENVDAQAADADAAAPDFDLRHAPAWRASAFRLSSERTRLTLTLHPIVADARSIAVLFDELAALLGGTKLAAPASGYGDYATWQRRWLASDEAEQEIAHRATMIADVPALDWSRRRLTVAEHPRRHTALLRPGAGVVASLRDLAARAGAGIEVASLALLGVLLARLSGQGSVTVALCYCRSVRAIDERMVGPAADEVAVRIDLTNESNFEELLDRVVRAVTAGCGLAPLERVVERTVLDASWPGARVIIVPSFVARRAAAIELIPGTLSSPETPALDLVLATADADLGPTLVHNGQTFNQAQLDVLASQLSALAQQVVDAPQRPIREFSLVTEETRALLDDPTIPIDAPLPEALVVTIARHAAERPDHHAIEQGDRCVTYAQLEIMSRRVAAALVHAGVRHGDVVAVAGELCPGYIVATLGVLRSGAVLLALDGSLSPTRRTTMMREARTVATVHAGAASDADWPTPIFCVSAEEGVLDAPASDEPPLPELVGRAPACVVFTSGTTGVPKGVICTHGSIAHFFQWQRETFGIGPADRTAQIANLSFAVAIRDVFMPLTAGATLCLPPQHWTQLGAADLMSWVARERITVMQPVPSLLRSWLAAVQPGSTFAMRIVFCASEPLDAALVDAMRARFGDRCRIVNLYGATEMSQARLWFEVPAPTAPRLQPVGRALQQAQALVLTPPGAQAGIGEPGEIAIRSPFIALGYVNVPDDLAFRRNPFRQDNDDRIYLTGDIGVVEVDGNVTVIGRLDDQLKIHGVRIEPAEVAAVIRAHPKVANAAVIGRGEGNARSLVAYVEARDAAPSPSELRAWVADRLVDAMVPAAFVLLDRMPLRPNGKVDRAALPAPDAATIRVHVAPRDGTEAQILSIWESVLERRDLGVTEDFFGIGGDSLAAVRVLSRIHEQMSVALAYPVLFESPTVAELALAVAAARSSP